MRSHEEMLKPKRSVNKFLMKLALGILLIVIALNFAERTSTKVAKQLDTDQRKQNGSAPVVSVELYKNPAVAQEVIFKPQPSQFVLTTFDRSLGLAVLIDRAVGPDNTKRVSPNMNPRIFLLGGTGVRSVRLKVEYCLETETKAQAAKRLVSAGYTLAGVGELAGFLYEHPKEVEKWPGIVSAVSESSRWTHHWDKGEYFVQVPFVAVEDDSAYRRFGLDDFNALCRSGYGILVSD
jgi:hypothetical protein